MINPPYPGNITIGAHTCLETVLEKLQHIDLCISDLDDTDAPSPAKAIAYSFLTRPDKVSSPAFWFWAITCLTDLLVRGQEAEVPQWHRFRKQFLNDAEIQLQACRLQSHVNGLVYPGLQDFYALFPHAKKVYVSRNLSPIVDVFSRALGFDDALGNCFDEPQAIRHVLMDRFPDRTRILFKGDAARDARILEELKTYHRNGRITSLVSICVSAQTGSTLSGFDISVPQDYRFLALTARHYFSQSGISQYCFIDSKNLAEPSPSGETTDNAYKENPEALVAIPTK